MLQNVALRVGNKSKHQANGFCGALFQDVTLNMKCDFFFSSEALQGFYSTVAPS